MSSTVAAAPGSSHNPWPVQEATALSRSTPRLLPCIALGLALFLAQAAALLHSSGHAGPAQQPGLHSQLCDACLSFSTIFSMAGGPGTMPVLPPPVLAYLVDVADASLVDRAIPRAFRSRAPPRP
jgi:hypothetical protein